jgi:defect-in-organelle-trafficking protein DotD
MRTKIFLTIFLGLLLISCANSYKKGIKGTSPFTTDATMQKAEIQLANSAQSIQDSLFELASIQKAVYPAVKLPGLPDADAIGMGHLASIDWTGPIEPLVKNVAKVTYYKVRVLGKEPAIPILVSLAEKHVPIASILRDAAYQCGDRANIVVYPRNRIIELRYAKI